MSERRKLGWPVWSAILIICCGCVVPAERKAIFAEAMRDEILEMVPLGTSIDQARQRMEENGYQCSTVPKREDHPAALPCRRTNQTGWATTHTSAVDLIYDESESVTDVKVRSWGTGL